MLKFKNLGKFADGVSSRYQAQISEKVAVNLEAFKHKNYCKSWRITFISSDPHISSKLDHGINQYLDPYLYKEYAIRSIRELVKDPEYKNYWL